MRCLFPPEHPRTRLDMYNIVHIPNQMHFFKVNSQTTSCNNTVGNYLTSIAKLTIKTIDYENVPLERVEKALSPLVQVKSIGQPSRDPCIRPRGVLFCRGRQRNVQKHITIVFAN